eukprot:CAMPEP_0204491576 /NCGR_PEP_ID=MMETSP0471-20130131/77575_1 /ASSEMBLY_ACC=CAM_ASM_000602 /TAXON_ID=2969 /ORGANISM="Oxyrrhis marina" /LENGTH=60 /DNA_ID=CAMNT_0051495583 /DNA_START=200 /DNA_END=382 /DNA_ORIENTATION=-
MSIGEHPRFSSFSPQQHLPSVSAPQPEVGPAAVGPHVFAPATSQLQPAWLPPPSHSWRQA